jgi:CelD/BcsL family acetyltransferase involved in cellulose biosynthesis
MQIIEINKYSEFLSLKDKWHNILLNCDHTVFSTWEWLSIGWKYFGADKRLLTLLAVENGEIMGIAPLMYSVETMFGLRRGKIEFMGTGFSDYNDFIIIAGNESQCISSFINYLQNLSEKWACVDLIDIPNKSKSLPYLKQFSHRLRSFHRCSYLPLPRSYECLIIELSGNMRRNLRKGLERASNDFKIEFDDCSDATTLSEKMNIFFNLHQRRWRAMGSAGAFAEQAGRSFNIEIANVFSQKNWLSLHIVYFSGTPVSAFYGFNFQKRMYSYLTGFDTKYSNYSVGNLLLSHVMAKSIQEGITAFDFLRGEENYKDKWGATSQWNWRVILIPKGTVKKIENWLFDSYWLQGNRIKYLIKKWTTII